MDASDRDRLDAFLAKWLGSEGNERANYQTFFGDLCGALGVESPPPKGSVPGDPYCFDKDIKFFDKAESTRFADFYKQHCFLIEAKQGSDSSSKGHGKRGTKAYRDNLHKAFNQARSYAYNRQLGDLPPFLMVCDIGSHFEVWEGFSGEYGSYGARQEVSLNDLTKPEVFDRFVKIFTDPQALNPARYRAQVTREVAAELAKLSRWLEEQGYDPQETASFLMRCIFTMFAEDVGLLKGDVFTQALRDRWIPNPATFKPQIEQLWQTMNTGGSFGFERILRFNGSFFEEAIAFDLPQAQLEILYAAADKDWSQVEPAIFGTLLERALEKRERSRLGAHYTPRSYVERLVRPVVMEPLRGEWDEIEIELRRLLAPAEGKEDPTVNQRKQAEQEIRAFLAKLRTIKILDPACGTGNFLYVALDLLKGLEAEVITRLVDVTGQVQLNVLEQINPAQFLGIEINPRAAAIAELVIWIGYLQWYFKRFGNAEPPEPVLQAFGNIECRDAILDYDGVEPDVDPKTGKVKTRWGGRTMKHPVTGKDVPDPSDHVVIYRYLNPRPAGWPDADYVVSNPPFIGNFKMRELLGDGYSETLREAYSEIPETIDYVLYWWHKAAVLVEKKELHRFGFITTNTIRQIKQRIVIEKHQQSKPSIRLIFAVSDHPWSDQGAAVRISMTVGELNTSDKVFRPAQLATVLDETEQTTPEDTADSLRISTLYTGKIFGDLSAGADISSTTKLKSNLKLSCPGMKMTGAGFLLTPEEAKAIGYDKSMKSPSVIRKYVHGKDITHRPRGLYTIDLFGLTIKQVQQSYPSVYQWIYERVKPERDINNRKALRENWWIYGEARATLRTALTGLERFIVTPETAKHRTFLFLESDFIPDNMLIVIALEDAFYLGILSSRIHVTWSFSAGGTLEDRPRYTKVRCFDPFPFPDPTPEQKQKIRNLGDRLDTHRKRVQAAHPDITITGMYNLLEKLRNGEPFSDQDRAYNDRALVSTLKQIHDDLDIAVLDAYGWPHNITDEQILENLVALNTQRAEEERNGLIRWLRPEYQAPNAVQTTQTTLEGFAPPESAIAAPVAQQKWPTQPKAQLAAIRDLLHTTPRDWTTLQIATQFTGKNTKKKLDVIAENLERLEWFGLVLQYEQNGTRYWHVAESVTVA
jgi:hypothetical protein